MSVRQSGGAQDQPGVEDTRLAGSSRAHMRARVAPSFLGQCRGDGAEHAMGLLVGTSGEIERVRSRVSAAAQDQCPQPVNDDRFALEVSEGAEEVSVGIEGVDFPEGQEPLIADFPKNLLLCSVNGPLKDGALYMGGRRPGVDAILVFANFKDAGSYTGPVIVDILFGPNGEEAGRYHKMHLVPFGEYVPFEPLFGVIRHFVAIGHFNAGEKPLLFSMMSQRQPSMTSWIAAGSINR